MSDCGGCANAPNRCGNGLERIYPATAVRYGKMGLIGEFTHDRDVLFTCGAKVVIQTDRGIEIGQQVSLTCNGCDKSVTREQMRAYAKASGNDSYRLNNGRILREATASDLAELKHIDHAISEKIAICRRYSEELNLPMEIVDAEHVFGGERVIFYFMAEDRIDFRELVRLLAREFQTRIEMRQVGARDEARLLADYETCGRECCCKNFLKSLKPVGMQMAKLQKATLDPSKVSGRCGRLKCCLRYEHESYAEMNKKLPRVGRRVRTASEEGVVIDRQILTQLLRLRKDDGTIVTVCEEDILERDLPHPPAPQPGAEAPANGRSDRRRSDAPNGDSRGRRGNGRERPDGRDGRPRQPAEAVPEPTQVEQPAEPDEEMTEDLPGEDVELVEDLAEAQPPENPEACEPQVGPELDESPRSAEAPGPAAPGHPMERGPRPTGQKRGRGRRRRRRGGRGPSQPGGSGGRPN